MARATIVEIETGRGPARAHVTRPRGAARAALVLGPGASGRIHAPDIDAAVEEAVALGCVAVLVEPPFAVAGRRIAPPIAHLDESWREVIAALQRRRLRGVPLLVGGRSMGSRVACRTAADVGAIGVLCLAFPVQPPARKGKDPAPSRLPEIDGVRVPVLVVQGVDDHFGMVPARRGRTVAKVAGDHSLKADLDAVRGAVRAWLALRLD